MSGVPLGRYIITRRDGKPVPEDEPCFVVRGQDAFALKIIQAYIDMTASVVSSEVTDELIKHEERIRWWQVEHRPKLPD